MKDFEALDRLRGTIFQNRQPSRITKGGCALPVGNVQNVRTTILEDAIYSSSEFFTMKRLPFILSILLLLTASADAAPVIFIVRHAEKARTDGKDPDLSPEGLKRADALAEILKDSQIRSVFVTEFKRTQKTAAPTARVAHVSPTVMPADNTGALVEKLRAVSGNALVVGHGNTIPELLKALGIAMPVSIPEDDYTAIFAVFVGDTPELLRLHYPF